MGQPIEVTSITSVGDVAMFDTDRSITGQDGRSYPSIDEAKASDEFPGELAVRIFEADGHVDNVFVASNQVVARRTRSWSPEEASRIGDIIRDFFLYYPEAHGVGATS